MWKLLSKAEPRSATRSSGERGYVAEGVTRVLLMGGYGGYRHVGDDAILDANLAALRSEAPDVDLVILSPAPDYTASRHQVQTAPAPEVLLCARPAWLRAIVPQGVSVPFSFTLRFLLLLLNTQRIRAGKPLILLSPGERSFLRLIAASDAVLAVGGGYLSSHWRYDQLYAKCAVCVLARALGKAVVLSGQTIGPLASRFDRMVVRWALDQVDAIVVRDVGSSGRLLREIGVSKPIIEEATDDAIALKSASAEEVSRYLEGRGVAVNRPFVALCIHRWKGLEQVTSRLPGLLDELIVSFGVDLLLLPMCYQSPDDDREVLRGIREEMQHRSATHLFEAEMSDALMVGILRQCSFAITSRYHLAVFALANRVPCLAVSSGQYYETKLRGILKQYYQERFLVRGTEAVGQLRDRAFELARENQAIREDLTCHSRDRQWKPLPGVRYLAFTAAKTPTPDSELPRAAFEVLVAPPRLRRGTLAHVTVAVRNRGTTTWQSRTPTGDPSLTVSYHWRQLNGVVLTWDGERAVLPYAVRPNELLTIDILVLAPDLAGRVALEADICLEGVAWLSQIGSEPLRVEVEII